MIPVPNIAQLILWDRRTIESQKISSWQLMERAAKKCTDWIKNEVKSKYIFIVCGRGNNTGDGLAISRMLIQEGFIVKTTILYPFESLSVDTKENYTLLNQLDNDVIITWDNWIQAVKQQSHSVIIDCVFGYGFSGQLSEDISNIFDQLNALPNTIISIDLPSGLPADMPQNDIVLNPIKADFTLTFQVYKETLLYPELAHYVGEVYLIDIGLEESFIDNITSNFHFIDQSFIRRKWKHRSIAAYKNNFGHAYLVGGSKDKMGAICLSVKACLRTGAGLTTAVIPKCGYYVMQTLAPEAMTRVVGDDFISDFDQLNIDFHKVTALGIGPGLDTHEESATFISELLSQTKCPAVLDADALNIFAKDKDLLNKLKDNIILTPHPGEFDRLFGQSENTSERIQKAKNFIGSSDKVIVLKGHNTVIITKDDIIFNTTGNVALAKGGSGDVLTGMITSFLAQGYTTEESAILAMFVHGRSADLLVKKNAPQTIISRDIILGISDAILSIMNKS